MVNRRTFVQSLAALSTLPVLPTSTLAASEPNSDPRGYEGPLRLVTRTDFTPFTEIRAREEMVCFLCPDGRGGSAFYFPNTSTEQALTKFFRDYYPLRGYVTRMPTAPLEWSWSNQYAYAAHTFHNGFDHPLTRQWFGFLEFKKSRSGFKTGWTEEVATYKAVWGHYFDLRKGKGIFDRDQIACIRRVFSNVLRPYI